MNFIELIFALLAKLVPMASDKRGQLEVDGNVWYKRVLGPESGTSENKWVALLKEHCNAWYTQVGLSIAYIFLLRGLSDYLEGGTEDEDDDND